MTDDQNLADLVWRESHYDHQVHAFTDLTGQTAAALCTHSVPVDLLLDREGQRCVVCALMHGRDLAQRRRGDPDRWQG